MQGGCTHLRFYCVEGCGSYMYAPLLLPAAVQPCGLGVLTWAWPMGSAGGHGRAAGLPRRRRRQGSRPPKVHRSPRCLQPETPVGSRHAPEFLDETVEG